MTLILILSLPLLGALLPLISQRKLILIESITLIVSFIELCLAFYIASQVYINKIYFFTQYLSVDSMGAIILVLVALLGFVTFCYAIGYIRLEFEEKVIGFSRVRQYYILTHLFLFAMFLAILVTNPVLMWIAIEGTTLSTALLISFFNKPSSTEAAWKYLMVNSVGLLLGFFGTILLIAPLIGGKAELSFINWESMLNNIDLFDPILVKFAFIFIFIGFGTKMGLVPMHTWLPDAHSKAPSPTSSLLSGVLLNVAFLAILRYKVVVDKVVGAEFSQGILVSFGILTIVIVSFIILVQKNYKRLLAYSSIEHMGIIAMGVGFGGGAMFASILHMIYHSLTKSLLFLVSGNIIMKYKSTKISNVRGMLKTLPFTSIIFFMGVLMITGVPPFGIFLTEFSILSEGIINYPFITIIALFCFVIIFMGFLKDAVSMVFGKPKLQATMNGEYNRWTTLTIFFLLCLIIFLSLYLPLPIKSLIEQAVLTH